MNERLMLTAAVLTLCGCGMGQAHSSNPAEYEQLAASASAVVQQHRTDALAQADSAECAAEHARYDASMRPLIERMRSMSDGMDGEMMSLGRLADANLSRMCDEMGSELDLHAGNSCASAEVAANQRETVRHCDQMKAWLEAEQDRARALSQSRGCCRGCSR